MNWNLLKAYTKNWNDANKAGDKAGMAAAHASAVALREPYLSAGQTVASNGTVKGGLAIPVNSGAMGYIASVRETTIILSREINDYGQNAIAYVRTLTLGKDYYIGEDGVPYYITSGSFLSVGSSGAAVKALQDTLNSLGYRGADGRSLAVDGVYGANTQAAVEKFQSAKGLKVDGLAGTATLGAMGITAVYKPPAQPPTPKQSPPSPSVPERPPKQPDQTLPNAPNGVSRPMQLSDPSAPSDQTGNGSVQGIGLSANIGAAILFGIAGYYIWDNYGNSAVVAIPSWGGGLALSVGVDYFIYPEMDNIFEFGQAGATVGISVEVGPVGIGASLVTDGKYIGGSGSVSLGVFVVEFIATTAFTVWWIDINYAEGWER